ncbi:MAG: hypothetical protein IT379_07730, partial [Deltaproteobacteria bacterium]|nr:hypothetical protein [Deltaproteobacteria bacterium]
MRSGVMLSVLAALAACGAGPDPRADPDASAADGSAPTEGDAIVRGDAGPTQDAGPPPRWAPCGAAVRRYDVPLPPLRWGFSAPAHRVAGTGDTLYAVGWDRSDSDDLVLLVHVVTLGTPDEGASVTTRERSIGRVIGAVLDGPLPHAVRAEPPAQALLTDHDPEAIADIVDLDDPGLPVTRHVLPEGANPGRSVPAGDGFAAIGVAGSDVFEMSLLTSRGVMRLAAGDIAESGGFFWGAGTAGVDAMWLAGLRGGSVIVAHGDRATERIVVRQLDALPSGESTPGAIAALADGGALVAAASATSTRLEWLDATGATIDNIDVAITGPVVDVAAAGEYPEQVVAILT